MRYRKLGNSGTVVSVQALGTMTFGSEADEATSLAIMDAYAEAGGTFIDTADVYTNGVSEEIVGRWLRQHPVDADQMVVTTKGRFPMGPGANDYGASRRHLTRALESSLRRLQTERIDLYQVHAWDALTPLEETLRFFDDAITAGKIGAYGLSNYTGWQTTKAALTAQAHGWAVPVTIQSQYSMLARGIEHEIVPAAKDQQIGVLAWSPLAGGWLTGKYAKGNTPRGATRLGEHPERGMEAWSLRKDDGHNWAVIDAVRTVAAEQELTPATVALAWLDTRPGLTSTIVGARSVEQLAANMHAASITLPTDVLDYLTAVSTPQAELYPYGEVAVRQRHRNLVPQ